MESSSILSNQILESLVETGFYTLEISGQDFKLLRKAINDHFLKALESACDSKDMVSDLSEYMNVEKILDHKTFWKKSERILTKKLADTLLSEISFLRRFRDIFNDFDITDEELLGYPNIYWRLVRPMEKGDIGPLHRDEWFWMLNPQRQKQCTNRMRIKCWIPIDCIADQNGLLVSPASHKNTELKFESELRDGIIKPVFTLDQTNLQLINAPVEPGQALLFHDKLIHGGSINKADFPRVSMEFTILTAIR